MDWLEGRLYQNFCGNMNESLLSDLGILIFNSENIQNRVEINLKSKLILQYKICILISWLFDIKEVNYYKNNLS